jgi:membrane-associated phospholipid phosphatase
VLTERRARRGVIARAVTEVLAPANLVIGVLLAVAWHSAPTTASRLAWGAIAAGFAGVLPLAYLLRGVRQGRWDDHHVGEREKRPAVIVLILSFVVVGTALLAVAGAPRELLALLGAMVAGLVVTLAITLAWKISVHAAVASGTVVVLTLVFGPVAAVLALLVVLVGWSRVALGDHTVGQVVGGALAGGLVAWVVFSLLR